jgi:hypothetical protein
VVARPGSRRIESGARGLERFGRVGEHARVAAVVEARRLVGPRADAASRTRTRTAPGPAAPGPRPRRIRRPAPRRRPCGSPRLPSHRAARRRGRSSNRARARG